MTNDDLKRLYNINAKPQQKKDFARYDENGRLKAKAGVEDDDVATVGQLGGGTDNALTKPTTAPSTTQIVAVDNTNTQTMLNIGDGLSVENGSLKASGGTGGKLYYKKIKIRLLNTSTSQFSGIEEIDIYFYESNNDLYTIDNIINLYTKIDYAICKSIQRNEVDTTKLIFGCMPSTSNFTFFGVESRGFGEVQLIESTLLFSEIDGTNITLVCESQEV